MTGVAPAHPVVMGGYQFGFFESCEFSSISFERLKARLHQEIRHYEGNRFVSCKKRK